MTELSTETYPEMSWSKMLGGETSWSETSGSETSRSKKSRGETSWVRIIQIQKVRGRNVLVQNLRGQSVQTVWVRKVRVRKHFLSLHFMIVKLPLWLWHSLRLLYDCEVLLLLTFKSDLWLVNWFDLIPGNMSCWSKTFIWKWYFNNYKVQL